MNLTDVVSEYGCDVSKFTSISHILDITEQYNRVRQIPNTSLKYISCKSDAGVLVIVTNKYVLKLYRPQDYSRIVEIYRKIKSFDYIEKIYYYYAIKKGIVIHDTYINYRDRNPTIDKDIYGVINELLIPVVDFKGINIISPIKWDTVTTYKLLYDVSSGLDELHINGIIHNDATLDNVGLRPGDMNFVLFDFGYSVIDPNINKMKQDVIRFLESLLSTFQDLIYNNTDKLKQILELINKGPYYIGKFKNTIYTVYNK
jgi:serine/threonine protein kinase